MDIEERKQSFLNLLKSSYKANQANQFELDPTLKIFSMGTPRNDLSKDRITIDENILEKYGFGGSDFWNILVPCLKTEGYIKDFGDPNCIPNEYYEGTVGKYRATFTGYSQLRDKLMELDHSLPPSYSLAKALGHTSRDNDFYRGSNREYKSIDDEIEEIKKALDEFRKNARNSYPFFVVNKEKLFSQQKTNKEPNNSTELYLSISGDLWREPKSKYCYHIVESSDRHKIMVVLSKRRGYSQTKDISSELANKNLKLVRGDIGKIKSNMRKHLGIKGEIIEWKKGSGYRISPRYKISLKNN